MRGLELIAAFAILGSAVVVPAQEKLPVFDVASVRASQTTVGPDYNNQLSYRGAQFTAEHATLERLIAEAWNVQLKQVSGPAWIEHNEYEVQTRAAEGSTREQMALMLRRLLVERFGLKVHTESRPMRVYELEVAKTGAKVHAIGDGEKASRDGGFHFHGDMRQFADLLALQFSIPAAENPSVPSRAGGPATPVLNKTGLAGTFDFSVDIHPELGTDAFTSWQRVLEDQLGLKIESVKSDVEVVVVDDALKMPTEN